MADKKFLDEDVFKYDEDETESTEAVLSSENTSEKIESVEEKEPKIEKIVNPSEKIQEPILKTKNVDVPKTTTPKKKQKKRQLKQDIAIKKLISISQKNIKVVDILKNIPKEYPSDSEYICQAIIEKYERENEFKNTDIKSLVKDALEELVGEKYIIMKGSSDIQIASNVQNVNSSTPVINQSSINQVISEQEETEKESLLLGLIDNMEDDEI